jgi:hypothetical protein
VSLCVFVAASIINRNDLNALEAIALEAKENLGVDTFTVLVDKATTMEGNCQCIIITSIGASYPGTKAKKSVTQPDYLVAKFIYNEAMTLIHVPKEKFKNYGKMA